MQVCHRLLRPANRSSEILAQDTIDDKRHFHNISHDIPLDKINQIVYDKKNRRITKMLLVSIILFPLFCLYIFIRAMQEERKEKEEWEKFKKDVENSHPYKHVPGYRRL